MHNMVRLTHQSPPVDVDAPYSTAAVRGKVILITGGASGFGAAFARHWARLGATVVVADMDRAKGAAVVAELAQISAGSGSGSACGPACGGLANGTNGSTSSPDSSHHHHHHHHRYIHCDTTSWDSQVALFKEAARTSPTGGIDAVVPCAGVAEKAGALEHPAALDGEAPPPPPDLRALTTNLVGVVYTVHLALFWMGEGRKAAAAAGGTEGGSEGGSEERSPRDRHILLIGSVASLLGLPGQPLYSASKHGLLGLFRSLRATTTITTTTTTTTATTAGTGQQREQHEEQGIRINMLCPYFIQTPMITRTGRLLLAGGTMGRIEDCVDAATRLVADEGVRGRVLVVGPRLEGGGCCVADHGGRLDEEEEEEEGEVRAEKAKREAQKLDKTPKQKQAIWECCAHDLESVDVFSWRYVQMLNRARRRRGWIGTLVDLIRVLFS
jgi:NAD(P)-dependent dehydrogenase (short-subunit alcohol dehydrogenase family)